VRRVLDAGLEGKKLRLAYVVGYRAGDHATFSLARLGNGPPLLEDRARPAGSEFALNEPFSAHGDFRTDPRQVPTKPSPRRDIAYQVIVRNSQCTLKGGKRSGPVVCSGRLKACRPTGAAMGPGERMINHPRFGLMGNDYFTGSRLRKHSDKDGGANAALCGEK
jgi:hypothetical protein